MTFKHPTLADADWLRREYIEHGRSTTEIALSIGAGSTTVADWLYRHGIPSRPPGKPPVVMAGERFGQLVVLAESGRRNGCRSYLCQCDCGDRVEVRSDMLRRGTTRRCESCRTPHGHARSGDQTSEYRAWCAMTQRCTNPRQEAWPYYGGRGITICDRWRGPGGFKNFLADMGAKPEGKTLDRVDVNGNYEPGNCRWATTIEQRANRRTA